MAETVKTAQTLAKMSALGDRPRWNKLWSALRRVLTPLSTALTGSATYDPASLIDAAGATTTVTVTGAALGDYVACVSFDKDLQGITLTAYVSAANTVSVRFQNESTATVDLASGTLRAVVIPAAAFANVTNLAA